MAQERTAKNLDVNLVHLRLKMGSSKKEWLNLKTNKYALVEDAVLAHYELSGWRGYSKEGGLLLNLIKSMSFPEIAKRNRATYIEALYAQNVAFDEDKFESSWLLNNVRKATKSQIQKNFRVMASKQPYAWEGEGFQFTSSTSMLDFFPKLEEWMFVELFDNFGSENIHKIAEIFSQDPYEYRKGWPDLTIWKDGQVSFLEVKGPGDSMHTSQKVIIKQFIKPLGLNFSLIDVQAV